MMYIKDIIRKKRQKQELNDEEINFFVQSLFKEEISEAQASAIMTLMFQCGLSEKETIDLAKSMSETGDEMEFYRISNKFTDIHPLGGISDKMIIMIMIILNAMEIPAGKVIGRELGLTDRLESVSGFKIDKDIEQFKEKISNGKIGVLKGSRNIAPVENRMYRMRNEIACDGNLPLIISSIMSQKYALGFFNIFFEITYGNNAFVKNFEDAKNMANYLVRIGKKSRRNIGCAVTKLNQPTGRCFGNLIEMHEIYELFNEKMEEDVEEELVKYISKILEISGYSGDTNKNRKAILEIISSGKAVDSFKKMIYDYGGDFNLVREEVKTKYIVPVIANESGYVEEIDINMLRGIAQYLNAIRISELDSFDIGAGIKINKKVGEYLKSGEICAYVYTNNDIKISNAVSKTVEIFKLSEKKIKQKSKVEYII